MSKKCLYVILIIISIILSLAFFGFYQMKKLRKMIPIYKIGDVIIDDLYEGFTDEEFFQCITHLTFNGELTISSFLGNIADANAPEYCKIHHNMIYQKITKALHNIEPKNGKYSLKYEIKDGIYNFYYEVEQNFSNFDIFEENIVNNTNNDKRKVKYDDEIEQYYINSRKDCVEYGLKSPEEEIIVCTKYL